MRVGSRTSAKAAPRFFRTGPPFLLYLLLAMLSGARAQTYVQGLPTVGNGIPTAAPSKMSIDATQFFVPNLVDMCGAIATACGKLGSSSSYPRVPLSTRAASPETRFAWRAISPPCFSSACPTDR